MFRYIFLLLLYSSLAITCQAQQTDGEQLFDGKDLKGWEHIGPGKFVVEDGLLKTEGGMGLLWYTGRKFGNCVIKIVYTVTDNNANSGVFIRIPSEPEDPWQAVNTGYEVQIDNGFRHRQDDYHVTGVLYSLTKALAYPQKRPGEWNTMEITLDGPVTIVVINGKKVTHYAEGQPVPEEKRWFEPDRGPRPYEGYIGLQNHDDESIVYFKEVSVRSLR